VWALVVGQGIWSLGAGVLVPYWGLYLINERHATGAQAGALLALAGGMGLVGGPLGGILADRIGRRRTLVLALALNTAWFVAYGSVSTLVALAVLTLFGVSGDLAGPASSAAIVDLVDPDLRAEAFGLRRQAGNLAFALGPPLGGLLTLNGVSLRWIFFAHAITTALYLVIVLRELPETKPPHVVGESRPRFRTALRDRLLVLLALGTGIGVMVYVQFDSVLGVFLHRDRGYTLAAWGLLFTINPMLVGICQYSVARWAGRRSPRAMLSLGVVLEGSALFVLWPTSVLPVLVAAIVTLTVGEMILSPVASTVAANLAPVRLRGSYEAVVDAAFAVSWAPGVLVGLWLVGSGGLMLAAALPLSALAALLFQQLPRTASL
jgi:predicted MFS family arabinose efflux permease